MTCGQARAHYTVTLIYFNVHEPRQDGGVSQLLLSYYLNYIVCQNHEAHDVRSHKVLCHVHHNDNSEAVARFVSLCKSRPGLYGSGIQLNIKTISNLHLPCLKAVAGSTELPDDWYRMLFWLRSVYYYALLRPQTTNKGWKIEEGKLYTAENVKY